MSDSEYTIITKTELARLKKCERDLLDITNLWTSGKEATTTTDRWSSSRINDEIAEWKTQAQAWREVVILAVELDGMDVVFPQGSLDTVLVCVKNWIRAIHTEADGHGEDVKSLHEGLKRSQRCLVSEQERVNRMRRAIDTAVAALKAVDTGVVNPPMKAVKSQ